MESEINSPGGARKKLEKWEFIGKKGWKNISLGT